MIGWFYVFVSKLLLFMKDKSESEGLNPATSYPFWSMRNLLCPAVGCWTVGSTTVRLMSLFLFSWLIMIIIAYGYF
jgi:hypothetical protein